MLRTAEGAGASGVILSRGCVDVIPQDHPFHHGVLTGFPLFIRRI